MFSKKIGQIKYDKMHCTLKGPASGVEINWFVVAFDMFIITRHDMFIITCHDTSLLNFIAKINHLNL